MRPHSQPSLLRVLSTRIAVGGAAGLASVLTFAPVAVAAEAPTSDTTETPPTATPDDPTPEPTDEAPAPVDEPTPTDDTPPAPTEETPPAPTEEPAPTEDTPPAPTDEPAPTDPSFAGATPGAGETRAESSTAKDASEPVAADIVPDFGGGKYRVGVQIADGSYVPAGTTTAGSTFLITQTASDGTVTAFSCTTVGTGPQTFCPGDGDSPFGTYSAPDGASISVTQTAAAPGLVAATGPLSPTCEGPGSPNDPLACQFIGANAIFDNKGSILPVTRDDRASTPAGKPVTIDVLSNDDSDDPYTGLTIGNDPSHGTAEVTGTAAPIPPTPPAGVPRPQIVAGAGSLKVVYTPKAGFSGTDTFTYSVSNSNGSTTGTVTVKVVAPAAEPSDDGEVADDSASNDVVDSSAMLPDTGGEDFRLLGVGAAMLAAGGWLLSRGRRRPEHDAHVA